MNKESSKNPSKKESDKRKLDKNTKKTYSYDIESDVSDIDAESTEAIVKLKQKLKKCLEERKEFLDGWQRSKAELINARKQDAKANEKISLRIQEDFIFQLLPILDSFDMAFTDTKEQAPTDGNWRMGIQNIHSQLKAFLRVVGASTVGQVGESFDPKKHDSIETIPTKKKEEDGLIVEVIQSGYTLNDVTIRAARVRVSEFVE